MYVAIGWAGGAVGKLPHAAELSGIWRSHENKEKVVSLANEKLPFLRQGKGLFDMKMRLCGES